MNQIKKSLTMSLNLVMMTRMRQTLKYHRVQFNGKLQARLLEKILLKKLLQLKLNKLLLLLLLLLLLKKYQRTRKLSAELVRKPSAVSKYLNSTSNFYTWSINAAIATKSFSMVYSSSCILALNIPISITITSWIMSRHLWKLND